MKNVTFYVFKQNEQKKLIFRGQLTQGNIPKVFKVTSGQSLLYENYDSRKLYDDSVNSSRQQLDRLKGYSYHANKELQRYEVLVCELAAKYWRIGKRVLIACESLQQAERLDEALWHNSTKQFIPHNLAGEGPKKGSPIELSWPEQRGNLLRHLLINLLPYTADFVTVFQEVIDFAPCEEHLKKLARERYKSYRRIGFHLNTEILIL